MTGAAADKSQKTILLVDDEPAVRSIIMKILRRANYLVLEADSGAAAVKVAQSHTADIDLVVTDLYMPGQQGPEVVKDLAAVRPGLKVLFISGYADPEIVARIGVSSGANFLQKPFSALELTNAVSAAIG